MRLKLLTPLILALMLSASGFAQSTTYTFGSRLGSGNCSPILTQDGATIPGNYYVCFQDSEFDTQPGWSIYLPSDHQNYYLILEGCTPSYGPKIQVGTSTTYSQHDTIACAGWTGTVDETFTRVHYKRCGRYKCTIVTADISQGGSGELDVLAADGGAPFPNCSPHCCGKKLGDPNICDPDRKLWEGVGL